MLCSHPLPSPPIIFWLFVAYDIKLGLIVLAWGNLSSHLRPPSSMPPLSLLPHAPPFFAASLASRCYSIDRACHLPESCPPPEPPPSHPPMPFRCTTARSSSNRCSSSICTLLHHASIWPSFSASESPLLIPARCFASSAYSTTLQMYSATVPSL